MPCDNSQYIKTILSIKNDFFYFEKVFLFGSVLYKENFSDIDILMIYCTYLSMVKYEKLRLENILCKKLDTKIPIHFTTLSEEELNQTQFLKNIKEYLQIR